MNQAIVWALVFTSGAGMSRVGPSTFSILSMNERAIRCSSAWSSSSRRAVDAALGAAERDPGDRRLPGHQRGQRAHLVDVDLRVEADPALVGAAGAVVLDPVAGEDVRLAVRQLDRDLDGDLAIGGPEDDPEVVGEPEVVGREVEVVADDVEVRDLRPALSRRRLLRCLLGGLRRLVRILALADGDRGLALSLGALRFHPWPAILPQTSIAAKRRLTGGSKNFSQVRGPDLQSGYPGAIAQLGERLLCKQEVAGSNPAGSTNFHRGSSSSERNGQEDVQEVGEGRKADPPRRRHPSDREGRRRRSGAGLHRGHAGAGKREVGRRLDALIARTVPPARSLLRARRLRPRVTHPSFGETFATPSHGSGRPRRREPSDCAHGLPRTRMGAPRPNPTEGQVRARRPGRPAGSCASQGGIPTRRRRRAPSETRARPEGQRRRRRS